MMAQMIPELRLKLSKQPLIVRAKCHWLLWRLNRAQNRYRNSLVGDAGHSLSSVFNNGRSDHLFSEAEKIHDKLTKITRPIMSGAV